MVKLKKHIKKLTVAVLSGVVAFTLFAPGVMAESDAVPSDPEAVVLSSEEGTSEESTAEVSYSVRLAAWADEDYSQEGTLYHVGKSFYVDVVVSGDSFSAFQGDVLYDSNKLMYDDTQTQTYVSDENESGDVYLSIAKISDGTVSIVRTGNATTSKNKIVARIYFTAIRDKQSEITASNVKVGIDSSKVLVPEDNITSCTIDVTKTYLMVDPVLGSGSLQVNGAEGYYVDVDGTFAVDLISIGTSIDCAQLTMSYDSSKLEFDTAKAEEAMTDTSGLKIDYSSKGQVTVIRSSSGIDSGKSIARLWFKATAGGTAVFDLVSGKAGTVNNQMTYAADDLAGCKVDVNEPEPEGVKVTLTDYIGASAEYDDIAAGENTLKGEFTFTVKSASTPAAAYTTDGGQTYTKLEATKSADTENTYSFTAAAVEGMQIAVALLGDVNLDGFIDSVDAQLTLQAAAELISLNDYQGIIADVNADGSKDAVDAQQILRFGAGIISEFA